MKKNSIIKQETAVITGATSGIGKEFACRLAGLGYNLVITGRRENVLAETAAYITEQFGVKVTTVIAELSDPEQLEKLGKTISAAGTVSFLVNNAGFGTSGLFHETKADVLLQMAAVQASAPIRLCRLVLPGMMERKSGYIVNVSSLAGFMVGPASPVYSATKSLLTVLSESLYAGYRQYGIKIQALCPGFTFSDFHSRMNISQQVLQKQRALPWLTAKQVVTASLKQLQRKNPVCIPGFRYKFLFAVQKIIPRTLMYNLKPETVQIKER